jgi:hypothetical protein
MSLFPSQFDLLDHFDGERFASALSAGLRSRDVDINEIPSHPFQGAA